MDPLKIFATLDTSLSHAHLLEHLRRRGWSVDARKQTISCAPFSLQLEHSGDGLYTLQGEIPRTQDLDKLLEPLISAMSHEQSHINLDVFEEDGRLVKRLQN
jgi:hypothetical protein